MNELQLMHELSIPDKKRQREAIVELERRMLAQPQIHMEPIQLIHGGMYARAVTVPKGTILTGDIYLFDHIEIMTSGKLAVTTDDGQARVLKGFNVMSALSGKKRAAYAIEETTWITVHAVGDTQDMTGDDIQARVTTDSFQSLSKFYEDIDRHDYAAFLNEKGWDETQVRAIVKQTQDVIELPLQEFGLALQESAIEGLGLFAQKAFVPSEAIMIARLKDKRTQAGRYINHALRPNAFFKYVDGDIHCICLTPISEGEEITVNYRDVFAMRESEGDLCQV